MEKTELIACLVHIKGNVEGIDLTFTGASNEDTHLVSLVMHVASDIFANSDYRLGNVYKLTVEEPTR